ncbi:uncharacterized protein A4U43_C04F6240 [Asparagus officinalis]|uniref:Growth-regulating factor n=1 Tax=Asparagus officinalis TaxID=4686 RepID=A0A5P1F3M1_ASPOF|nr:growth-regulating factor 3-like [Asparagus officinalis]ONK71231.1 uncharacterized protein A4U43_C04F6240 [Asparagus officinalis]
MDHSQWRNQQQPPAEDQTLHSPEPNTKWTTCRMGSLFSLAQWQELELQALIYKYMLAGASVPLDLILPLKRSLVSSSPYYHYQHFQPSMLQTGYWGRSLVDPEPWRCRRTDGKKWRCSREVVAGQKYCERHVHRGRNRSRKHVEAPTSKGGGGFKAATLSVLEEKKQAHFTLSGPSPTRRPPDSKSTDGRVLMRFFDDWPRSEQDHNNNESSVASDTHLSISVPESSSSDFSLKLSTGNTDSLGLNSEKPLLANWSGWDNNGEASMGGPLAEALRSSTSTTSPTSVLRKLNGSVSEASSAST